VKQEFRENGLDHFQTHRVLELMLYYCVPQKDTNPLAHRLIDRFGSFAGVLAAPYELLLEVDGVGQEVATYLRLLEACTKRYMVETYSSHDVILTTKDAKEYMQYRFLSDAVECVLLVCLNQSGKVTYAKKIAQGTLERVDIIPSDVVKTCLRANAVKAVLAHNHPGGFCNPSRKDLNTTHFLDTALMQVDVELFDHIIVASDGVFSLKENGMHPA
jgi:DNA repair protein RadC